MHALYGFARRADDILDDFDATLTAAERADRLQRLATRLFNRLTQDTATDDDLALAAVVHTARKYGIAWELFDDFLGSMRMDLTVTDYPDRGALGRYMYGSAEVIGLQLLPVLGTICPREEAAPYAAALGKAFQLTNFLRDVDEDLERGRIYLPADELAAHDVDRDLLMWCHTNRRTDVRVRRALIEQHAETRRIYGYAHHGISLLQPAISTLRGGCPYPLLGNLGLHRGDRLRHLQPARHRGHRPSPSGRRGGTVSGVGRASARRRGITAGSLAVSVYPWGVPGDHGSAGDPRARCVSAAGADRGRGATGHGGVRHLGRDRHRRPRLDV